MGIIESTSLATSTPLNLTFGFPLFPANTTINNPALPLFIGIGGSAPVPGFTLFDTTVPLAIWRFQGSLTGQVTFAAFFGYNLGYTVSGQTRPNGTAELTVSNDSAAGGVGVGLGFVISLSLRLEQSRLQFSWGGGLRTTWERVLSFTGSATVDLIDLTLRLFRSAGIQVPMNPLPTSTSNVVVWGLFDSVSRQFAQRGSLTLRPAVSVGGNILSFIPQLRGVIKALKKLGGKIFVGPTLNIVFPMTIRMMRLRTEDGDYSPAPSTGGVIRFTGGPTISPTAPPVQQVTIVHSHTIGLEFTVDIKLSVSIFAIFSATGTIPIDLNVFLPVPPLGTGRLWGPYFTQLSNSGATTAQADLPEVIWG